MDRIINYIEVKIEDFRIAGGTPSYIVLSWEILNELEKNTAELKHIFKIPVYSFLEHLEPLPEDGIYIK